ncbi:MAG TPA: serine/threonine-protein kinase [Planctomycetota bacterium]|nr:serine/threonine-protein kinase [Planctomycetota bacterium]
MPDIPGYTLNQKMTEGGCAEIYSALEQSSGKLVVVKVLHPRHLANKAEYKRLQDEGALCLKLGRHDNIAQVFHTGMAGNLPYVVMEFVRGRTLRELVNEKRLFNDIELLKLAKSMCRALRFVHEKGYVHKDIKPDNIMISQEGRLKLLDFGFAEPIKQGFSLFGGGNKSLDGSPAYMAPELFSTKKATVATDVYALGCTLYEMATGAPPFTGMSSSQVISLQRDMTASANPISKINKHISLLTERMILTMCQKDANKRFKSCEEILLDLARNPGWRGARESQRITAVTA